MRGVWCRRELNFLPVLFFYLFGVFLKAILKADVYKMIGSDGITKHVIS